jgi:HD-GYP domain-containing protein (c-di-GMP phosphodiesterase class II)/CHASE2 domain-containing sensor protein
MTGTPGPEEAERPERAGGASASDGPGGMDAPLRARTSAIVAGLAIAVGLIAYLAGAWPGLEDGSVGLRFAERGAQRPNDVVVVGIDDRTLSKLRIEWPFPRSLDAKAIERLHGDGAKAIVYDVQFTQPTTPDQDDALYEAIEKAPGVVLATSEIGQHGETEVLGGNANLTAAHARAGAADFGADPAGAIQRYRHSISGLQTLAVAGAEAASGRRMSASAFEDGSAWIDFRGPPGTVPAVSFSDLIEGHVPKSAIAGKVVVIGATSPVLQDMHATSTTSGAPMPGPEVQANAVWTALHGNPLRSAPGWLAILCIVFAGLVAPLAERRLGVLRASALALALGAAYALAAQFAFDAGVVIVVTYPLAALLTGTVATVIVCYAAESWRRELVARYAGVLERTVRQRTAELLETQHEIVHRLARAAELRDEDTGHHLERMRSLCERLALELGIEVGEAEQIGLASVLHDIGKLGVPDKVLLKQGEFDDSDWEAMRGHAGAGADMLADSASPLMRAAETIARTHHERWDGGGYPAGLAGTEIPLPGRICAVCDVLDALLSERPYKPAWSFDEAMAKIAQDSGSHFDPDVVAALQRLAPQLRVELGGGTERESTGEDLDAEDGRPLRQDSELLAGVE